MSKPIYRHLAEEKWNSYNRKIVIQRITQMHVIPDVLPKLDPSTNIEVKFRGRNITPGDFVPSILSAYQPNLQIQAYDRGSRLVTVVTIDLDCPDFENDAFYTRCHFLATNIQIEPTAPNVPIAKLDEKSQVVLPWLPPFAQKGSPYHRLVTFVLEQKEQRTFSAEHLKTRWSRDGFNLRSFVGNNGFKPVGVHIFRNKWDPWTAGVMHRASIEGADVELKRKGGEKSPVKKRDTDRYR